MYYVLWAPAWCTAPLTSCPSVQPAAKHPDTFAPGFLPFSRDRYEAVVRTWYLPRPAIETTMAVGPFFWCNLKRTDTDTLVRK